MTTYTSQAEGAGCVAVLIPGIAGLVTAAVLIGVGVGLITPIGFAYLAATAPEERLGQTMGAAEVGRELGDAGGPLLVGAWLRPSPLPPRCWFSADDSPPLPLLKSVVAECLSNMIIQLDGRRHLQVDKAVHNWENRYRAGGAASGNLTLDTTQSPLRTLGGELR